MTNQLTWRKRMSENAEMLERLDHYADSIQRGIHVSGTQMRTLLLALHAALTEQQEKENDQA